MPLYSIIIPLYNRPDEIKELLESLLLQDFNDFEVIIIEDGSDVPSLEVVISFLKRLKIQYHFKPNSGPGLSRNFGAEKANSDYFIFLDSDCIIPSQYMNTIHSALSLKPVDAFGGPDKAHTTFTMIQKAISYSMTSFFTTGGIRGGKEKLDKFHPRSFNMGMSRAVYEKTKGFSSMRFGEDVDLSLRILELGFTTQLIEKGFVYHKRRTDFKKFFKQVHNSGIARINLFKRHPNSLKLVHFLPATFTIGIFIFLSLSFVNKYSVLPIVLFIGLILVDATIKEKSIKIGLLSVVASFVQLIGYGSGFIRSFINRLILQKKESHAFKTNFYK